MPHLRNITYELIFDKRYKNRKVLIEKRVYINGKILFLYKRTYITNEYTLSVYNNEKIYRNIKISNLTSCKSVLYISKRFDFEKPLSLKELKRSIKK